MITAISFCLPEDIPVSLYFASLILIQIKEVEFDPEVFLLYVHIVLCMNGDLLFAKF